ncbi:putative histidine kinase HHK15p [Bimuria novae-zelandiae CBS 107.79]|uniref:Putative histidine kinase HHK15p n=1 Tax=Bimuria novae-zelandiae CBS 107.79 TaxID=1447943 RepID=A0A6A5VAE3_9PLEO|nr:putative histidine kinase HHK15p [Bimuria novae-zelandiae CBS 107.79]
MTSPLPLKQGAPAKLGMPDPNTPPPETGDMIALDDGAGIEDEYDWTLHLPQTDHVRFFRETDWSKSALGPLNTWDPTLRVFTRMMLADSRAACIWWGDSYTAIYNEHYAPLAAAVHPKLMGSEFIEGYPELWSGIKPIFDQCRDTGVGVDYSPEHATIVERKGWREEAYFNGNFVPIGYGPTNRPQGYYNSMFEVTSQRLADRRTMLLNRLACQADFTPDTACSHVIDTLATNGTDLPLAMLYEVHHTSTTDVLRLRGHYGLPKGHNLIVDSQRIDSNEGLMPECRRAASELLTINYDERFGSVTWAGFGSPSKTIGILPIKNGARVSGYLIVGTNPYRPFDDACQQFLKELSRIVSSVMTAAFSAARIRERQRKLEDDLAFSDMKLRHLIEHVSVGMIHMGLDGSIIWANDQYYTLSGMSAEAQIGLFKFWDVYMEEDLPRLHEAWDTLKSGVNHVCIEMRVKRLFHAPNGEAEPAQLQILAFPYREGGEVRSIMACTTDISRLKWAETFQARLAAEAREAKRQQEAFIDVVSHEMRNPLSAIVHCADSISSAVEECHAKGAKIPDALQETLNDSLSSANVIMQCAIHQKRIIDDVLTLSKLDSMLLSITPTPTRPTKLVNSISSIFQAELKSNNIHYSVTPDPSLTRLSIDHVYLDPSRVTQIFINLLTNAIKFVKNSHNPSIAVRFGATKTEPRSMFAGDTFWASKTKDYPDVTASPDWGQGEEVYLTFSVQDSGIGLKGKEIHKIFERFHQANTKTHVKYGGSGLGLFISKELTEKQGGEIGVSSVAGEGSTFGFYIKARRVERRPQTLGELYHENGGQGSAPQNLNVLLVEDNVINQQVLGKQLKKAGCVIDVANHGLEALDMVEKKVFDVVLMDLEMPVLNGLEATKAIRKREAESEGLLGQAMEMGVRGGQRLPIIAVTANVRQEQIRTAITAGADRVMQKPFKAADLVHMMKGLVPQVVTPVAEPNAPGLNDKSGNYFT